MLRGEIWLVNLDPTIGSEIRKSRPAVIVNRDSIGALPMRIIVPITSWQEHFSTWPWLVPLEHNPRNGLVKKSAADTFQVRSVSDQRLVKKLGKISDEDMQRIEEALELVLDLD
jgi:mRNA interferase MazF